MRFDYTQQNENVEGRRGRHAENVLASRAEAGPSKLWSPDRSSYEDKLAAAMIAAGLISDGR